MAAEARQVVLRWSWRLLVVVVAEIVPLAVVVLLAVVVPLAVVAVAVVG